MGKTRVIKKQIPDCDKLLHDIRNGCVEECANCDYSRGVEFECQLLNDCAQAIEALKEQVKKITAERDDILEMLHSYRHICGERDPSELSRLVTADDEQRCMILPYQIGQTVQHRIEGWTGKVKEFVWNEDGLVLYVAGDDFIRCVWPGDMTLCCINEEETLI